MSTLVSPQYSAELEDIQNSKLSAITVLNTMVSLLTTSQMDGSYLYQTKVPAHINDCIRMKLP